MQCARGLERADRHGKFLFLSNGAPGLSQFTAHSPQIHVELLLDVVHEPFQKHDRKAIERRAKTSRDQPSRDTSCSPPAVHKIARKGTLREEVTEQHGGFCVQTPT